MTTLAEKINYRIDYLNKFHDPENDQEIEILKVLLDEQMEGYEGFNFLQLAIRVRQLQSETITSAKRATQFFHRYGVVNNTLGKMTTDCVLQLKVISRLVEMFHK